MTYHLSGRWIQRAEPLSQCASRLANMLETLAAIHPALTDWRRKADTKAAAYKPFCAMPPQLGELENILQGGRTFARASGQLAPEAGYFTAAWNGREPPEALSISFRVGCRDHRVYPNDVTIEGLCGGSELVDATLLKRVLVAIADCWDADWGVVEDWAYEGQRKDPEGNLFFPYGGWLTYLARDLAEKISPPPAVHSERTPDGGLLMLVSEEAFDLHNSVHLARLDAVQQCLAPVQQSPPPWPQFSNNRSTGS